VAQAAGLKDQLVIGGRTRAEHTENMYPMFVTLDVSRLSGWLNVFADCRVEREAWEEGGMQAGGRGGGRGRRGVRKKACGVHPGGGLGRRGAARKTCTPCL